jgi:hypothetical protein
MAKNNRKEQVIVNEIVGRFLDGKVEQGFKRSSYIRALILAAMREELNHVKKVKK